uniref:Uncharacterized protein n=1 Tax=Brassica oleracea TaxID=3712 RepID=A0A3P6HJ41_BRAOL|nr:unnamed protein product [Brassica oleracea]
MIFSGHFLIISSAIPVLAFLISGVLSPITKGPEKLFLVMNQV